MATHEYSRYSPAASLSAGTAKTFTTAEFTVPAGERFVGMKVVNPNAISTMSLRMTGSAEDVFGTRGWDTYKSNVSSLWKDGNGAKIQFTNPYGAASGTVSTRLTVIFKTEDIPYTAVKAGDKIKATDRSQTGQTTTPGNRITDSHFSAGTSAKASTFNDKVLGL